MPEARRIHKAAPSLLRRLLSGLVLILAAGAVFVTVSTWFNGRAAAWEAYDRLLLGAASDIAESIRIVEGTPIVSLPTSAFELLAQAPDDRVSYAVRGPGGTLITGFETAPSRTSTRRDDTIFFEAPMDGETARFVATTRRFAERDYSGEVTITVGQTLRARRALTVDLMLNALVPMAIAGIALIALSVLAVRHSVRPLGEIARDLSRRDPYDLTPVPTENVPREVSIILDAMNSFVARLEKQFNAMQTLISDTAHQLRTPVAAIRAQAESAIEETDADKKAASMARLTKRTRSLGTLLDQLLSRALIIHRTDSTPRALIDLRDVALDIVEARDHAVLAPNTEVELVIGEAPVYVTAESFSLVQAGKNLLSNALKHGQPPVRIGVDCDGTRARLWVEDGGSGLDPSQQESFGQRFQRTAVSREDSAGLGLSIVSAVAAAFDGEIAVLTPSDPFRIALVLPCRGEGPQ